MVVSNPNYKWLILALGSLTMAFVIAMPFMAMTVLFDEISKELDLTLVQIGIVWGILPVGGVLFSLIGGMLGDRFGAKLVIGITCILAGLFGAARGLSADFVTLTVTMFLFGLPIAITPTVVTKSIGTWFQGRQLALAQSIAAAAMALGFTLGTFFSATVFSPFLGGWKNVMYVFGAICVVLGFLWFLTRSNPDATEASDNRSGTLSLKKAVSHVFHIKNVWLLTIILAGHSGCVQGMLGYLPLYLRDMDWTATAADGAAASFHLASLFFTIPIAVISNRLGSRKLVMYAGLLLNTLGVALLSVFSGPLVWLAVIMAGISRDGFMAICVTALIETEDIGPLYSGTAMGLAFTFSRSGIIFSPPVGNSLESIGANLPFLFWAFLAAISLVTTYFLKETARRETHI